jgi:hypothetical protein
MVKCGCRQRRPRARAFSRCHRDGERAEVAVSEVIKFVAEIEAVWSKNSCPSPKLKAHRSQRTLDAPTVGKNVTAKASDFNKEQQLSTTTCNRFNINRLETASFNRLQ